MPLALEASPCPPLPSDLSLLHVAATLLPRRPSSKEASSSRGETLWEWGDVHLRACHGQVGDLGPVRRLLWQSVLGTQYSPGASPGSGAHITLAQGESP